MPVEIDEAEGAIELDPATVNGDVDFEGVGFRYGAESDHVLGGVDIHVPAHTTLAYLLARLYDVGDGAVRIDGIDVREFTHESLAAVVGLVSQETYLFHAS